MNEQNFQVGQTVVLTYHRRHGGGFDETPVRVAKVWKNGVIEIETLAGKKLAGRTFRPDGYERGSRDSFSFQSVSFLRPLANDETAEAVNEGKRIKAAQEQAEQDRKDTERRAAVDAWWAGEGQKMWDSRVELPGDFLGSKVNVIRYSRHNEQYMPFVVLSERMGYKGERLIRAKVGGLSGRTFADGGPSISTYSQSDSEGATLAEVLYRVTH